MRLPRCLRLASVRFIWGWPPPLGWLVGAGCYGESHLRLAGAGPQAGCGGSPDIQRLIFPRSAERTGPAFPMREGVVPVVAVLETGDGLSERC